MRYLGHDRPLQRTLFLFFSSISITLAFSSVALASPPALDVEDGTVFEYSSDGSSQDLQVTCHGDQPLHWDIQHVSSEYYNITESQQGNGHKSVIEITDPFYLDTGNYTCCYKYSAQNDSCPTDSGTSTSAYIYVYDGKKAFLKEQSNIVLTKIGKDIVLDCRTTHPNITVHLFKDDKNVSNKFDVDRYFIFSKRAEYLHEAGFYACKEDLMGKEIQWHVTIDRKEAPLHKPNIKQHENAYHVVGLELRLNCSIPYSNGAIHLTWNLPNLNTTYTISEFKDDAYVPTMISSLFIPSPRIEDSGNYSCTVRQGSQSKTTVHPVNFQKHVDSFVKIERPPRFLSIWEGGNFQWISHVKVYPEDPVIKLYNPFNEILQEDHRVSIDFIYDSGLLTFRIDNVQPEDFGQYTAQVVTRDELASDDAHVIMIVNATPKVEIQQPHPNVFVIGENITLTADILSYGIVRQEPTVTWWFKPDCESYHNASSCDSSDSQMLESTVEAAGGPKNRWKSKAMFPAESSGYVFCNAESGYGANVSSALIIVSDIEGRFVFHLESESGTQGIYSTGIAMDVIEGDDIEFKCAGLHIFYESASLTTESTPLGRDTWNCSTPLTVGRCLTIPGVTSDANGRYVCQGVEKISNAKEIRSVDLNVKKMKEPQVIESQSNVSLSGTDITVKVQSPFSLLCVVQGRPEPTLRWLKDGIDIESISNFIDEDSVFLLDQNKKLEFKFARSEYGGVYTCQATSRVGEISPYATVTIDDNEALYIGLACGATIFILLLFCLVGYLTFRVRKERRQRRELRRNQFLLFEQGNVGDLNPDCLVDEQANLLPYDKAYEVAKHRIQLGKHLGGGAFGKVVLAEVEDLVEKGIKTRVAVKMCKETKDTSQLNALAGELKIMIHLGKHLNIVKLMGACTTDYEIGDLWVMLEYCKHGNLLKYIHKNKRHFVDQIDRNTGLINYNFHLVPRYSSSSNQPGDLPPEPRSRTPSSPTRPTPTPIFEEPLNASFVSQDGMSSTRPVFYAANPQYGELYFKQNSSTSDSPQPSTPAIVVNSDGTSLQYITSEKFIASLSGRHPSSASSTQGSDIGAFKSVNTDMTRMTSPCPMNSSEVFCDTQGYVYSSNSLLPFNTSVLISWAWQIANGMEYLSSRKVLHGDLAARNILLCEDNVVKICDFGFSRDIYKNDIYMKKEDGVVPIKWMSLEAIQERIFSTQSDVWAYGVTLWEIFTLGNTPYPEAQLNKEFVINLEKGYRMDKPKFSNEEFYDIMLQCWNKDPMKRPTFAQLRDRITPMMDENTQLNYVAMNACFNDENQQWFKERTDYMERVMSPEFSRIQDQVPENIVYEPMLSPLPQGNHIIVPVTQISVDDYLPMNPGATPPSGYLVTPISYGENGTVFTFSPRSIQERHSPSPEKVKLLGAQQSIPRNANNNLSAEEHEMKVVHRDDPPTEESNPDGVPKPPDPPTPGPATYANVPAMDSPPYVTAGFL